MDLPALGRAGDLLLCVGGAKGKAVFQMGKQLRALVLFSEAAPHMIWGWVWRQFCSTLKCSLCPILYPETHAPVFQPVSHYHAPLCPISHCLYLTSVPHHHALYSMLCSPCSGSCALYPMPVPTTPHPCLSPRLTAALPVQVKQERPPPSPSSQGMLDRSRMALCTFVFLCLSFNPLASLLQGSGSPAPLESQDTAGPGRSIMAQSGSLGKLWCEGHWDGDCWDRCGMEAIKVGMG